MIHLIDCKEKNRWDKYVKESLETAFCHTNDYHSLEKHKESFLFVFEEDWGFIAIPFLKQPIPNTNYYDLTSVYGYGGPISNLDLQNLDEERLNLFEESFLRFLKENNFVSVFLRLNPFTNQSCLFKNIGGLFPNGRTVAIDLNLSVEERRRQYRANVKYSIRKCKQKGFCLEEVNSEKGLHHFMDIYNATIYRKNASEFYFFSFEYVSKLLRSTEFEAKIYVVYDGDIPICGTLIIFYNEIVHVHLIGTVYDYYKYSPAKFTVDRLCDIGKEKGMKFLHLGSGVSFKEDSLFEWKKGFSNILLDYHSWRYVPEKSIYLTLVKNRGIDPNTLIDFFPLYRYKLIG
ncbi:hypothetical protein Pedsa_0835 [Pseudopedobacter saltans DSM 12145]|uniref:BioF2-like acetyltransferase domain-containing protein n=1 Tax=Pseudopedobacter saltans (strain ATCC 51119 / DSM 12145 / JCM 21818 / CCUG 39354 / LMG 10337 / NBRC 100064 / NCIMB 13643) TaxID=762903 RepID=F0S9Q1_PSESL|nr:GNAT family N-acetyltransferase [Pseudopedobacter saltans]ADY51407.1 hypothetical protein Pedsa_0835 [Pseudopedobacter saltans DSM 12145]